MKSIMIFAFLCSFMHLSSPALALDPIKQMEQYLQQERDFFKCDNSELDTFFVHEIKNLNYAAELEIQHIQKLQENDPIIIPSYLKTMLWFKKTNFEGSKKEYLLKINLRKEIFLNDLEQRRKKVALYQKALQSLHSCWHPASVLLVSIATFGIGALSAIYLQNRL